jgi:hypothetical protein
MRCQGENLVELLATSRCIMSEASSVPEAVICVPGPWGDRSELIQALVRASGDFIFAGRVLMNMKTRESCELVFESPDERMLSAFLAAAPHWAQTPEMAKIKDHRSVVYLVGHGGSHKNFAALMLAANALVKAGGYGVKIESTGLAHSPAAWGQFCDELHLFSAHRACVLYLTGDDAYSCGMHNLGMKDAIVENLETSEAVELLRTFTWYMYTEQPSIREGQTFSVSPTAPVYRIANDPGVTYDEGSLFANPYGFWRLEAA